MEANMKRLLILVIIIFAVIYGYKWLMKAA